MSMLRAFRKNRVRVGLGVGAIVLSLGGLILTQAPSKGGSSWSIPTAIAATGKNLVSFSGNGASGTLALTHTKVLSGTDHFYAEMKVLADKSEKKVRAPMSIAVVIDVSGSMSGDKIEDAKSAIVKLVREMQADDEIAVVKYSSDAATVQSLKRVGDIRSDLIRRVQALQPEGGTNIPSGLERGLAELKEASAGRVKRIILASDGLDSGQQQSQRLSSDAFERGIMVSSLGIGLDFNESYMSMISRAGHGNFAFVEHNGSLAGFLKQELEESANTVVDNATMKLSLPEGVRYVRAFGADVKELGNNEIEVRVGALFSGDEKRATLEFETSLTDSKSATFGGVARWKKVGGDEQSVKIDPLTVVAVSDAKVVEAGKDPTVVAHAVSVLASDRQIKATEAYARGDVQTAQGLIAQNRIELARAMPSAPAEVKEELRKQDVAYDKASQGFAAAAPQSAEGKIAAKRSMVFEAKNLVKAGKY